MNTAGNLFWTNVTEMLKENNESLRSIALYMRECKEFVGESWIEHDEMPNGLPGIKTLEGVMEISNNDYIIKGVDGEFYPCKPEIKKKTYEVIE